MVISRNKRAIACFFVNYASYNLPRLNVPKKGVIAPNMGTIDLHKRVLGSYP